MFDFLYQDRAFYGLSLPTKQKNQNWNYVRYIYITIMDKPRKQQYWQTTGKKEQETIGMSSGIWDIIFKIFCTSHYKKREREIMEK